jgi:hypothetical protein
LIASSLSSLPLPSLPGYFFSIFFAVSSSLSNPQMLAYPMVQFSDLPSSLRPLTFKFISISLMVSNTPYVNNFQTYSFILEVSSEIQTSISNCPVNMSIKKLLIPPTKLLFSINVNFSLLIFVYQKHSII